MARMTDRLDSLRRSSRSKRSSPRGRQTRARNKVSVSRGKWNGRIGTPPIGGLGG